MTLLAVGGLGEDIQCTHVQYRTCIYTCVPVDSISRDGPDIAIYVIHYKNLNNSEQLKF